MRAYYNDLPRDQGRSRDSSVVPASQLWTLAPFYWHIPTTPADEKSGEIDEICGERPYKNRDEISVTKEGHGEIYEERLNILFTECVVPFLSYRLAVY